MAQIREIKRRIKSITNTSKVTHAMELISAAKMRKAQEQALSSRPYTITLNEVLAEIRAKSQVQNPLLEAKDAQSQLLVLLTTDRGFVGGLNINIFREISRLAPTSDSESGRAKLSGQSFKYVVVGKKGTNFASKTGQDLLASFQSEQMTPLELARVITKIAIDAYIKSAVSAVKLVYSDFKSTVKQIPTIKQILPIEFTMEQNQETKEATGTPDEPIFEPSAAKILENVLPHYILTEIYQAILEGKASEHSARMVAMKNATDAAGDLVDDLTLTYNQARQEAITKELLDIVTAQSAFQ